MLKLLLGKILSRRVCDARIVNNVIMMTEVSNGLMVRAKSRAEECY